MFVNDKNLILITLNVLIIISDLIRLGAGKENNATAEAHAFVAFVTTLRIIFPLLLRLRRLGSDGAPATAASLCLRCRCVAFLGRRERRRRRAGDKIVLFCRFAVGSAGGGLGTNLFFFC